MKTLVTATLFIITARISAAVRWDEYNLNVETPKRKYVECYDNETLDTFSLSPDIDEDTSVVIIDCGPPQTSYAAIFKRFNVTVKNIELQYARISAKALNIATPFEGLTVENLIITNNNRTENITTDIIEPLRDLKSLYIKNLHITSPLPTATPVKFVHFQNGKSFGEWGGCKELRRLTLDNWNIDLAPERWLANCSKLTAIKVISDNLMSNLNKTVAGVSTIRKLSLNNAMLTEFSSQLLTMVQAENMSELEITGNYFRVVPLRELKMKLLANLVLRDNDIVELQGIPSTQMQELRIDLSNNKLKFWHLQASDFDTLRNVSVIVRIESLTLNCDCQNGMFIRALRSRRILILLTKSKTAYCDNGLDIVKILRDDVECDRFDCSDCSCRRQWSDNSTVARCGGGATRVPRVLGLRALYAADNRIVTISAEDLPDTLLMIDLSRNHLSIIDKNAASVLFRVKERSIRLAGNPLACHCDNKFLIEMLQTHKVQVEDYDKLWCSDGGRLLSIRSVMPSELCAAELQLQQQVGLHVALAVCAVLLGLAVVSGLLYCRYRQHLKVYLYARGYCMWCIHEEEVDSDRRYDAFISYSHCDEEFVLQEILPHLDNEYKLCLHFRDWVVGDFIPAQITRSVEQSRRTIIVLSRNFIQSVWGLLEFRTAHTSALDEGRARVIVIVLDDVVDDEGIDPELRSYIRTNTYVRWGDKWFWNKLRYAMPHHRIPESESITIQHSATNNAFSSSIGSSIELRESYAEPAVNSPLVPH